MIPTFDTHEYDRYYCALITPYKADSLEIDYDAYRKHVRYFTQDPDFIKVNGALIVNPEAGEMFYMSDEERDNLAKIVLEERPAGMPVFGGAFALRRDDTIKSALRAKAMGVDGIFVMPMAGTMEVTTALDGAKDPKIWTDHVRGIAEATQLPLIIHPSHSYSREWGNALPGPTVKMVCEEVPSVVGWKMIYGNTAAHYRVCRILRTLGRHVAILNAPQQGFYTAKLIGMHDGEVYGSWNFLKEGMLKQYLSWEARDVDASGDAYKNMVLPVNTLVYGKYHRLHVNYKIAAFVKGCCSHPFMRPPMPPPEYDELVAFHEAYKKTGVSHISREELESVWAKKDTILNSTGW